MGQPVGRALLLLFKTAHILGCGIHPNRMAAEKPGGIGPLVMIRDRLAPLGRVRVPKIPLTVAHDQDAANSFAVSPTLEFAQVVLVGRLFHHELIHQFNAVDAMRAAGNNRKIQVIHLGGTAPEEGLVIGPFRQTDPERNLRPNPCRAVGTDQNVGTFGRVTTRKGSGRSRRGTREKPSSSDR